MHHLFLLSFSQRWCISSRRTPLHLTPKNTEEWSKSLVILCNICFWWLLLKRCNVRPKTLICHSRLNCALYNFGKHMRCEWRHWQPLFGASILLVPVFQQIGSTFPIKPVASCGEEDVDSSVKGFLFKGLNMLEMILPSAFGKWCCLSKFDLENSGKPAVGTMCTILNSQNRHVDTFCNVWRSGFLHFPHFVLLNCWKKMSLVGSGTKTRHVNNAFGLKVRNKK